MLLQIQNLCVEARTGSGNKRIVDNVSFDIAEQKIIGLVGGSGSGKTTTGLAVLRLLAPELKITGGEIVFDGKHLLKLSEGRMRSLRGRQISMVFQEPLNAFNPVFRIGYQIEEMLKYHTALSQKQGQEKIKELLDVVGIKDPQRVMASYPHQLSGGMRQRAMIAQAIAANPKLIIADEPTSNVDVTIQARILDLFKKLRSELNLTILLITHDLGVVKHLTDEVVVMSGGEVVEKGQTQDVLNDPQKEYTQKLMEALSI